MPFASLSVLDNKNSGPYLFYQRQFWSCVKVCGPLSEIFPTYLGMFIYLK